MSSQFHYELNEKQLKLTMLNGEINCDENLWEKFEVMSSIQPQASFELSKNIPTINLGISRSVIVPIIFVFVIGCLSALLINFVDFKKKTAIQEEVAYTDVTEVAKVAVPTKTLTVKPQLQAIAKIDTLKAVDSLVLVAPTNTVIDKQIIVEKDKVKDTVQSKEIMDKKETKSEPKPISVKKKKVKEIILPTININTNLNDGVVEPELELK